MYKEKVLVNIKMTEEDFVIIERNWGKIIGYRKNYFKIVLEGKMSWKCFKSKFALSQLRKCQNIAA